MRRIVRSSRWLKVFDRLGDAFRRGVSTRRRLFALLEGYFMTPVHEGVRPVGAAIRWAGYEPWASIAVPGTGRVRDVIGMGR